MHNFPQYCIIQQRAKYGRKAEKQKCCTQQNEINDVVSFFVRFSSNKSLSTPDFFSDGHEEHFNGFSTALS